MVGWIARSPLAIYLPPSKYSIRCVLTAGRMVTEMVNGSMRPKKQFIRRLLVDWSAPITFAFVALALGGAYVAKNIDLKLSLVDLLPQNHPGVVKFNKLTEIVGGVGYMEIVIHAEDGKSHLKIAPALVAEFKKSPMVRSAFFDREEHFFLTRALYYGDLSKLKDLQVKAEKGITKAKRKFFDLGIWGDEPKEEPASVLTPELKTFAERASTSRPQLTSKDGKDLLLLLKPNFDSLDMVRSQELVKLTEKILREKVKAPLSYRLAGRYYSKVRDAEIIDRDIVVLGLLSNIVMAVILLLYFRSVRAVISIFIPVVLGLGVATLATWAVIGHINLITGFLVGIISGVGSDYGIHMLWRLRLEQREPSGPDPDPLWRTLATSGWANFVTIISTVLCFLFMCGSSFRVFSEFGFICAVGLSAILFSKLGSFYWTSKLLGLEKIMAEGKYPFADTELPVLAGKKPFLLSLVLTALLICLAPKVGFEFNFEKMMQHSADVAATNTLIAQIYNRSADPSAFATDSKAQALEIEKYIKDKYMPHTVQSIISGASIVPDDQQLKAPILAHMRDLIRPIRDKQITEAMGVPASAIRTWVNAAPFTFADVPIYIQEALRGTKQAGYLIYVYPEEALNNGPSVAKFSAFIKDVESKYPEIISGSDVGIFSDILDLVKRDGIIILSLILICVGIFIWINLRNFTEAVLCYVPFILSLPMGIGLMAIFGVQFNIFNTAILPALVAVGIEIPIQLMQRAREVKSGFKAVRDVSVSLQLSLLTTFIGFGTLVFTRAGVLKSLGWISLLSIAAIWFIGLFVQPAILERYYRRPQKAKYKTGDEEVTA